MKHHIDWTHYINQFRREKIILLSAFIFLILGALLPWYNLPPLVWETFDLNFYIVNFGRILAVGLALLCLVSTLWLSSRFTPRLPFWSGLFVALLFPYLITTWSPPIAFVAKSYHQQANRVIQHVEKNFFEIQSQWKRNITLDQPEPVQSIMAFNIDDSRFFQMSSLEAVVRELGYSNGFLEFIGFGWSFTVIGCVTALIALYVGLENEGSYLFLRDVSNFSPWAAFVFCILLFSIFYPQIVDYQLNTSLARGNYNQVLKASHRILDWYPPFTVEATFLERVATAGFYLDKLNPDLLYFAKGLANYNQRDLPAAVDNFRQSLAIKPDRLVVREFLATTLIRQGVEYFNQSNWGAAINKFNSVIQIFPGHVEGLYDLMLAQAVNGDYDKSALSSQQLREIYQYFQLPNPGLLGQTYLHSAWTSYHNGNVNQAWEQYRKSVDPRKW